MSQPVRLPWLAPLALALAVVVGPARADDPVRPRPVTRVYSVADLVVPIRDYGEPCCNAVACPTAPAAAPQETLIRLIQNTVLPQTWAPSGGTGTIDYMPIGYALVVNQTPDVQEHVAQLLEDLRHLQDREIAVEVRLLTVGGDCVFNPQGVRFDGPLAQYMQHVRGIGLLQAARQSDGRPMILDNQQLCQLLEAAQSDPHTNVLQAPKLTVFNGQRSTICNTEDQSFVTGVDAQTVNGQGIFTPKMELFTFGLQMTVCPKLSADGKSVLCDLRAEHTALTKADVALFPVTTFITPVFEGGAQGQPIPFTQFIQQPAVSRLVIEKSLAIPDGNTAVLYAGDRTRQEAAPKADDPAPLFGWVTDLMGLFSTPPAPPAPVHEHMFVLVTPRVIDGATGQVQQPAAEVLPMPKAVPMPTSEEQSAPKPAPVATPCCPAWPNCMPPAAKMPAPLPCPADDPVRVTMRACILRVDPAFFDRPEGMAWSDLSPKACAGKACFLNAAEAQRFCQALKAPNGGEVQSCPTIMTLSGQMAAVNVGNEISFVTGLKLVHNSDGSAAPEFHQETRQFGVQLQATPTVSPDGRSIELAMTCEISRLEAGSQDYQVTITAPDGSRRTATLSNPMFHVDQTETNVSMLPGRTVLVHFASGDGQDHILMVTPCLCDPAADCCPTATPPTCPASCPAATCPTMPPASCPAAVCPVAPTARAVAIMQVVPAPATACPTAPTAHAVAIMQAVPAPSECPVPPPPQVQINARILRLDPAYFDRPTAAAWAHLSPQACAGQPRCMSAEEAERFCQAVRAQNAGRLVAQPRLVTLAGRPATFAGGGEEKWPSGVMLVEHDGTFVPECQTMAVPFRFELTMLPEVSADGRFVRLQLSNHFELPVPAEPTGPRVTYQYQNGSGGFLGELRGPTVRTQESDATVACPVGGTVLMHCGSGTERHIVMLTPYLVGMTGTAVPAPVVHARSAPAVFEEQAAPPTVSVADARLAKLLVLYRTACASGDATTARQLAALCLEIDPTCFGK